MGISIQTKNEPNLKKANGIQFLIDRQETDRWITLEAIFVTGLYNLNNLGRGSPRNYLCGLKSAQLFLRKLFFLMANTCITKPGLANWQLCVLVEK